MYANDIFVRIISGVVVREKKNVFNAVKLSSLLCPVTYRCYARYLRRVSVTFEKYWLPNRWKQKKKNIRYNYENFQSANCTEHVQNRYDKFVSDMYNVINVLAVDTDA